MQKPMMDSPEMDRMQGFRRRPPAPGTNTGPVGRPPEGGAKGLGLGRLARLGRAFQGRPRPTQDQTGMGGMMPGLAQAAGRMIRPPQPDGGPDGGPGGGPVAQGMMSAIPGIARQMGLIRPPQPGPDGPPEMAPFAGGPAFQAAAEQFQRQYRPMQRMELPPGPDGPPDVQKWDAPQQFGARLIGGAPTEDSRAADFAAAAQKVAPQPSGPFLPNGPDDEQYRRMFMS